MPLYIKEKGKVPHTYCDRVIRDVDGNLGTPVHIRVLQKARKCQRCEKTRVWSVALR